jgi:hypothetical protein
MYEFSKSYKYVVFYNNPIVFSHTDQLKKYKSPSPLLIYDDKEESGRGFRSWFFLRLGLA